MAQTALTELGFNCPTYQELLDIQVERAKVLFGEDIETDDKTPLGKYIRLNVQDISDLYEIAEIIYYARFPDSATGQSLDRLVPFAGITRNPATYAEHKVKFTGTAGEVIPGGFLVAAGDVQFYTLEDYEIGLNGTITGVVYCTESGTIGNVATGKIDTIVESSPIVLSVEHLGTRKYGEDIEKDVDLRVRFHKAISGAGSATIDAIMGAISRVPFVDGVEILENDTDQTKDGLPPHTFECYVLAPEEQDQEIADAIFSKKPIGIKSIGKVEKEVLDKGGKPHTIRFSRTVQKNIYIKCTVMVNNMFESNGTQKIKDSIAGYINKLKNNDDVYLSSIFGYIHDVAGVLNVPVLTMSTDGEIYSTNNISVSSKEVARIEVTNIEVTVDGVVISA